MANLFNNNRKLVLASTLLTGGFIVILAAVMLKLSASPDTTNLNSQFKPENTDQSGFNMPVNISFNQAEKYKNLPSVIVKNPIETISNLIASAKKDIYIGIYSINLPELKPMLKQATDRGVKIHIVYDETKYQDLAQTFGTELENYDLHMAPSFPDIASNKQRSLMHHKFIIIDPDDKSNATVMNGTLNLTEFQLKYDPSNSIVIKDYDVAQAYKAEFERISSGLNGSNKSKSIHYYPFSLYKEYTDGSLELWFSPRNNQTAFSERIKELIRQSKESIYFVDWYFSDESIVKELYKKHQEGVEIKGIVDDNNIWLQGSVVPNMLGLYQHNTRTPIWNPPLTNMVSDFFRSSKLKHNFIPTEDKYSDYTSFLHQHNMIIDGKILITGAGNWTNAADDLNDEDGLVIVNEKIVQIFLNNFWNHYISLGGYTNKNEWHLEVTSKPLSIELNRSITSANDTPLKLISVEMPYKKTFEESILGEVDFSLSANEKTISIAEENIQKLIPQSDKDIELYLINSDGELLASTYYIPN